MKIFIVAIFIVAGVWYWQKGGSANDIGFDKAGKPVVVIFTINKCDPCQAAIGILQERGVPFQEKMIEPENGQDKDAKIWRKVSNNMLPLTISGNNKVAGSSKWELISLLGGNFGDQYLMREERTYFGQHFDAKGSPKVVLYGTDWCPTCAALRKEFHENGISFVDIDVERSGEFDKLTRVMEIAGYPAIWVGYTRVHGTTLDAVKAVMNKKS